MSTFGIAGDSFVLNGTQFRIVSGAIHYFRVHPDYWADRIHKARLMGLNTIETYVPWNLHEPRQGEWNDSGWLDLHRFLTAVADEGMFAIVRPGPYICAEWDNGGLPAWLFAEPGVGVRRAEPNFLAAVTKYLRRIYSILAPMQVSCGGPVILVQIENEYGAYGDDETYLKELVAVTRESGIEVPLTTVDQPEDSMLERGSISGLLRTGSFGSRALERLETLRRHQATGPLMCSEFWNGWFDHWGTHHHTTAVEQSAADLDALLAAGASVNLYMFHGGTNFGFTNGANDKGVYQPIVTSYDYDAPLDESGNPTDKYWAFRDVIAKYTPVPDEMIPCASPAPTIESSLTMALPLLAVADRLGEWIPCDEPPTLDAIGHFNGFAFYATEIDLRAPAVLEFAEIRDYATVLLDGMPVQVLSRDHHQRAISLPSGRLKLAILLEDQGRVGYGSRIGEPKGLIGPARLSGRALTGWKILPLDFGRISGLFDSCEPAPAPNCGLIGPVIARGTFSIETPADLYLDTSSWGKGAVWINGFNVGRYWSRGPQHTLYVPAPIIKSGLNTIDVLETATAITSRVRFVARPNLGHTEA